MWLIEEYARSGRSCVWFIPPSPPIIAPNIPKYSGVSGYENRGILIKSQIGIIFCHVVSVRHIIHLSPDITLGSQKWHGAAPALIKRPNRNRIDGVSLVARSKIFGDMAEIMATRKEAEPMACAKKYFIAASVSWLIEVIVIRGIIDNRFSSILAHIIIQLFLDRAIIVESVRVDENKRKNGCIVIIKIEEELNLLCQN